MRLCVLAALAVALAGCDDVPSLDGVAAATGAHGMPVPETARSTESRADRLFFYEVDARLDDLRDWYGRTLVPGQAVGDWQWCGFQSFEDPVPVEIFHYVYRGAGRSLEIFAAQDRGARHPGITIRVVDRIRDC
jgi:hypothetical protein